ARRRRIVAARHRVNAVGLARVEVRPVLVEHVADAGPRRGHHVGARQHVEPAAAGGAAEVHPERPRGGVDVDAPVVAAAVDLDVAGDPLRVGGRVVAGHVEKPKDRPGGVPLLTQGGLGPLDGLVRQLPVTVQPVRVADHADDAVLAVAGRQVAGDAAGQLAGGGADVELAALDLLFGVAGGVAGGGGLDGGVGGVRVAGGGGGRAGLATLLALELDQSVDQLFLPHAVPTGEPLLAGVVGQFFPGAAAQLIASHAMPLPILVTPGRGGNGGQTRRAE